MKALIISSLLFFSLRAMSTGAGENAHKGLPATEVITVTK